MADRSSLAQNPVAARAATTSTATTSTTPQANGFISNIVQPTADDDVTKVDYSKRFNRAFVNDAQGNVLYVNQGAAQKGRIENPNGGYIGGWVGDSLNQGNIQRQMVVGGEVFARYGSAPDSEKPLTANSAAPNYVSTAEFYVGASPMQLKGANLSPVSYTVAGGETLKDIARNVLGDASLWWRIAEANALALGGDTQLAVGQTLTVPKVPLNANSADTLQPYEPGKVIGSQDPVLPVPAAKGGGCGGLGKIIMVVVAIVVTIYTAGALAAAGTLGSSAAATAAAASGVAYGGGASMLGATLAAGGAVMGGAAGMGAAIAAGALAGAAGSIASQAVGNAIGAQDGFSWKSVGLSALSGGVTAGLAGSGVMAGTDWGMTAARAATANALTQGIGMVTGLQKSFDWKGVAGAAVGAGVGWGLNEALGVTVDGKTNLNANASNQAFFGMGAAGAVLRGTLSGLGAGTAAAVARGGKVAIQQVATDAFGNALGQSLAAGSGQMAGSASGTGEDQLGQFIEQNQGAWNQRQADYDQMVDAFGNPTAYGRDDDVLLAAGPGYSGGMGSGMSDRDRNIARMLDMANRPDADSIDSLLRPDGSYAMEIVGKAASPLPSLYPDSRVVGQNTQGGEIWSEGGNTHPVAQSVVQGTPLGDVAALPVVNDFAAGWQEPYWSVLEGEQPMANKLGSAARNFADGAVHIGGSVLSGLTGYGAANLARQEFSQGQYGRSVIHGMQALGEAGMTLVTAGQYALAKSAALAAGATTRLGATAAAEAGSVDAAAAFKANFVGPTIGRSGFISSTEFAEVSYLRYQEFVDQGYNLAVAAEAKGLLSGNVNTRIGTAVDRFSATRFNNWLNSEGLAEGAGQMVQTNRWLRDPSGSGLYVRPDIRIPGAGVSLDATVGMKWSTDTQIMRFSAFSGGDRITIVRPQQLGGSYSIWP